MQIYSETSKTKSGELRVTRPIGALLISSDADLSALNNEKITIFVERANGSSSYIATKRSLRAFVQLSTFGEGSVKSLPTAGFSALCEIGEEGAIQLGENESIKIMLEDLNATKTYTINGIEMPIFAERIHKFEAKTVLSEDNSRKFDVSTFEAVHINGLDIIDEMHVTYLNGQTVKYLRDEIAGISFDVDPFVTIGASNTVHASTECVLPLVGVQDIEVFKTSGTVVLTLLDSK